MPRAVGVVSAALVVVAGTAEAASITFENQLFTGGSGIGNVPIALVLQADAAEASQTGAVLWDGAADVVTGDAKSQSVTWSVAELAAIGITAIDPDFGLVLNINETNGADDVDLTLLQASFFDASGGLLFTAPYTPPALPLSLDEEAQGTGSSGFLFRVNLSQMESNQFFAVAGHRIGILATIHRVDGGAETIYLADLHALTGAPPIQPIDSLAAPEPASIVLLGSGLAAVGSRRMRSRRA